MKSISPVIPGMDLEETLIAKSPWPNQPPYKPLPAIIIDGRVISRWKLTWRERFKLLVTGNLWLTLLTFGQPLQPILIETDSPKRYLEEEADESLADA